MAPRIVADDNYHTAEGAIWHRDDGYLYWVDIPVGEIHRYSPASDEHERVYEGEAIRAITIETDGALVLFREDGALLRWDEEITDRRDTSIPRTGGFRFNDVAADPEGRVFAGVMPTDEESGALYRLDPDGSEHLVDDDVTFPNGMGFAPDRDALYFADSFNNRIFRYAYDRATGDLSNRTVFVDTEEEEGLPDGLTVDANGYVWSAKWEGGGVVRYDPAGTIDASIDVSANKVTSMAIGDPNNRTGYITTALAATGDPKGTKEDEGSGAGCLYRLPLETTGLPEPRSDLF